MSELGKVNTWLQTAMERHNLGWSEGPDWIGGIMLNTKQNMLCGTLVCHDTDTIEDIGPSGTERDFYYEALHVAENWPEVAERD
ncbi:MAG: hypothetical protein ACR2PA_06490 [Hyphomicrobiaceae bacterium]